MEEFSTFEHQYQHVERQIKLIWDFKGPNGDKIATHHEKHLKEYLVLEKLPQYITGVSKLSEMHSIAFLVVKENEIPRFRDALKPHRAEVFEG